jgi:hypothetical protein
MSICDVEKLGAVIFNGVMGWRIGIGGLLNGAMDGIGTRKFSDIWL